MVRQIKESDWKLFRRFHAIALERFCERVLEEVRSATTKGSDSAYERYLKVWGLMRNRVKIIAGAFNDPRRSNAFILLANVRQEGLLTDEEWMQFTPETRETIKVIESVRRA